MKSPEERYSNAIERLANKYQDPAFNFEDINDSDFREASSRICTTYNKSMREVIADLNEEREKTQEMHAEDEAICYQQLDEYGDDKPTASDN